MADVNANIGVNIDTSNALAQLKALQRQISQFHTSIARSSETAALAQRDLQRNFLNGVNAIGAFSAELRAIKTTSESFTDSLEKNKFSMREYFRFAGGATKTFGRLFRSEFDTINKVAEENVKRLQTQYIKMGRDASGVMRAIAIMPKELDLSNYSTQTQLAAQRQAVFNQLVKQGSTNLLNFGKNTQWAGRQLMVGFTLPLASLGVTASKTFMDMESAAIKFRKVYGDLFTPASETQQALDSVTALGQEFTKYGIAVSQTVGLAAEAAAAGFQGLDLQRQTTEATRLQVLGQIDQQKALETTISLQNAFRMSSEGLADAINFLNAVENQTVVSLDDITTAIPKAAPIVRELGGDVKDLAFFMAAMKEGGINASEGANALKSGLASLINPTEKASQMLANMGINITAIVEKNVGNVKQTIIDFGVALSNLSDLNRQRAIEQLFGKFQQARLSALFDNVIRDGNQASRVLELAGTSAEDLGALAEQELGITANSAMNKFRKAVEDVKLALVPVGKAFLEAVTPILEFIGGILEKFNNLSDGVKKAVVVMTVAIGAIGPVALMTFGLLANSLANIVKGALVVRQGYLRLTGQTQVLGEQTEFLTVEQQNALAVAHSLDQSHAQLTQTFNAEAGAVRSLANEYRSALGALQGFAQRNPGMMLPPKKYNKGVVIVPGSGNKDTVPAMLTPGESIIPADMTQKYGALIQGMIAGNIPGYQEGRLGTARAHLTAPFAAGSQQFAAGIQMAGLEELVAKYPQFIKVVSNLIAELPQSLNILLEKGTASIQEFSTKWNSATNKMLSSVKAGGGDIKDPEMVAALNQVEQEIGDRTVALAQGTDDQLVSDELLTQATREVIDKYKGMSDALGKVTTALDNASQQVGQVRIQPRSTDPNVRNTDFIRQGLASGEFTQTGGNIFAGGIQIARESQSTPGKLRPASSFNPAGSYTRQPFRSEPKQVVDAIVAETAQAAGTRSPSRRTIPIGEDIARGLQVGMQNQIDETAQVGKQLGQKAVSLINPRTGRPFTAAEKGAAGVGGVPPILPMAVAQQQAAVTEKTINAAEEEVRARRSSEKSIGSLNSRFLGATFALSSVTGALSMFGADLGGLSPLLFKVNAGLFALATTLQIFTNTKFLSLLAGGFGRLSRGIGTTKIGQRVAQTGVAQGVGRAGAGLAARAGIGAGAAGLAGVTAGTGGTALIVLAAMAALAAQIYMINKAYKKHMFEIERFGKAAQISAQELENLSSSLGANLAKSGFEAATFFGQAEQVQTQAQKFEAAIKDSKELMDRVETLRKATAGQATAILASFGIELVARGMSPQEVQTLLKTMAQMSGKSKVLINSQIRLDTVNLEEQLKNSTDIFDLAFKPAIQELNSSTKNLQQNLNLVAGVTASSFTTISTQLNRGTLSIEQANKAFSAIRGNLKSLGKTRELIVLKDSLVSLNPQFANAQRYIKSTADAFMLMQVGAAGVDLSGFISQIQNAKTVTDDLRNSLDTVFKGALNVLSLQRQVDEARATLADMEANRIKSATKEGQTGEQAIQSQIDALKKRQAQLKIQSIIEIAKPRQQEFKNEVTGLINEINATLAAVKVDVALDPTSVKNIFDIEKELAKIDMESAQAVTPDYRAAQFQVDDLNLSIEKYNRENDIANKSLGVLEERYKKQSDALQEVATIQDYIAGQQKRQITLADALSQGDISAAAAMAAEMQAESTRFRIEQEQKALENAPELVALREQIKANDEEIYLINEEIYKIQQASIKPVDDVLRRLEREKTLLSDMKSDYDTMVAFQIESLRIRGMSNREIEQEIDLLQAQLETLNTSATNAANATGLYTQAQIDAQRAKLAALEAQLASAQKALSGAIPPEGDPLNWFQRRWEDLKKFITEDIPAFFGRLPEMIATAAGNIWSGLKTFGGWLLEGWDAIVEWVKGTPERLKTNIGRLWGLIQTFGEWLIEGWNAALEWIRQTPQRIATNIGRVWGLVQTFYGWLEENAPRAWEWLRNLPGNILTFAGTVWRNLQTFRQWLDEKQQAAWDWLINLPYNVGVLVGLLWRNLQPLRQWLEEKWVAAGEWLATLPDKIREAVGAVWRKIQTFKEWLIEKWENAKEWLVGTPDRIKNASGDIWAKLPTIKSYLLNVWEDFKDWLQSLPGKIASIVGSLNIFGSIWDQFKAGLNSITGGSSSSSGKGGSSGGSSGGASDSNKGGSDNKPKTPNAPAPKDTDKDGIPDSIDKTPNGNPKDNKDSDNSKGGTSGSGKGGSSGGSSSGAQILANQAKTVSDAFLEGFALWRQGERNDSAAMGAAVAKPIVDEQAKFREQQNQYLDIIVEKIGNVFEPIDTGYVGIDGDMGFMSKGGMVKPKYMALGGLARGTDKIPAMLSPGEFIMSKYAVQNYGVDKLKAMNSGDSSYDNVYNYSVNVNVKSGSNPEEIARAVMTQIKQIDSQRIRGQRV